MIQLGLQFRSIKPEHIVFKNGVIKKIKGVVYDDKKKSWIVPLPAKKSKNTDTGITQKNSSQFFNKLDKYIKDQQKRIKTFKSTE